MDKQNLKSRKYDIMRENELIKNEPIKNIISEDIIKDSECTICMESYDELKKKRVDLVCDTNRPTIYHSFCKACLNDWQRKSKNCPTCKQLIKLPKIKQQKCGFFSCIFSCVIKN